MFLFILVKKKHEDNEIAQDSFLVRENKLLRLDKNQQIVTEHQLKKYLHNIGIKPDSLLLILFYVPCKTDSILFIL